MIIGVETITAVELADVCWDRTKQWRWDQASGVEQLRSDTKLATDDFRNELTYLLAFVDDFAFHVGLKDAAPIIQSAVRDAYAVHLQRFAQQTACKPMPEGEWVGDSMIYMTSG
jgi:hypothetical protein